MYLAKIKFEWENETNGRIKKTVEQYLVFAENISQAEEKVKSKFKTQMNDFTVISIQESKILGLIE